MKLCGKPIYQPLDLMFQSSTKHGGFSTEWEKKKTNVVPVHKKNDKKIFKSYQTASLLPICRTMFEPLMYNRLYEYFIENGLISSSQFGFEPGNSCINQSLCITHDIYQPFGNGFEFRGVFLVNYLPMTRAFFSNIW